MEIGRQDTAAPIRPVEAVEELPEVRRWTEIEQSTEFRELVMARRRFVVPATIFFLAYYFLLPIGNGLAPGLMRTNVIGNVNIAYLFALSQFIVAWTLAWLYIRRANTVFDQMAAAVRRRFNADEARP
jgi:uncharacterized membrane protein (DUF485 family)